MTNELDKSRDIARAVAAQGKALGFDHLVVAAVRTRNLGVRIAQSAVCRENVSRSETSFQVSGMWSRREASFVAQADDASELLARIRQLREDIGAQAEDKEQVIPET